MNKLLQNSQVFLKRNASTILTCIGGVGVVATAVMSAKATPKALLLLDEAKKEKGEELTKFEKVKTAAPAYIPAAIVGVSTIACVFGANALNKRQQADLMSAYALLDSSYKDYKKKVGELYGENADKEVKAELAKDKYVDEAVELKDGNKQLYYDEFSERYFEATTEDLLRAENMVNREMAATAGVFLNEFYDAVGLERTDYGDYMGWSSCELYDTCWSSWLEFYHEKVIMDDGLEVTIITFGMEPTFDFENYY